MEIATIERKYVYQNGNNNSIELDDIDDMLSHQQIMEHARLFKAVQQSHYRYGTQRAKVLQPKVFPFLT